MSWKKALATLLLGSLLWPLNPSSAWAYRFLRKPENNRIMHWKRSAFPIKMVVDSTGTPDVPFATLENLIKASINTWNAVNCTAAKLSYSGKLRGAQAPNSDNTNVIKFIQSPAQWPWGRDQFAITIVTAIIRTGEIIDADILMNDWNFTFGTTGAAKQADLQATITHELGHVLGLDHTSDATASMYAVANVGETGKRRLGGDDTKGLCDLYPDQPCKENSVNGDKQCFNGRMHPICAPYSQACEPCTTSDDCFGNKNFCITEVDSGRCGYQCSAALPCESGYTCIAVQDNNGKIIAQNCIPDNKTCQGVRKYPCCRKNDDCLPNYSCINGSCVRGATCVEKGDLCSQANSCCSGLGCVDDGTGARCREPCDPLSPRCPRGSRCALADDGSGFCVPPNGGGQENAQCNDQTNKCEYELYCDGDTKRCLFLCRPGTSGTCPAGRVCVAVSGKKFGLCRQGSSVKCQTNANCPQGQICKNNSCLPCSIDSECDARQRCLSGTCKSACTSDNDCNRGFRCDKGLCEPGVPCVKDSDCTGGLICQGSICSQVTPGNCRSDSDCQQGQLCRNGQCVLPDSCNNKCQSNQRCFKARCIPLTCQSDAQCGEGLKCRNSSCIEEVTNCGGKGPCPQGKECIQGRCVSAIGSACNGDEDCVPGLTCAAAAKTKRCVKLCSTPEECPKDYFCTILSNVGSGCWRAEETVCKDGKCRVKGDGCGCNATGQPPVFEGLLLLLLLLGCRTMGGRERLRHSS